MTQAAVTAAAPAAVAVGAAATETEPSAERRPPLQRPPRAPPPPPRRTPPRRPPPQGGAAPHGPGTACPPERGAGAAHARARPRGRRPRHGRQPRATARPRATTRRAARASTGPHPRGATAAGSPTHATPTARPGEGGRQTGRSGLRGAGSGAGGRRRGVDEQIEMWRSWRRKWGKREGGGTRTTPTLAQPRAAARPPEVARGGTEGGGADRPPKSPGERRGEPGLVFPG